MESVAKQSRPKGALAGELCGHFEGNSLGSTEQGISQNLVSKGILRFLIKAMLAVGNARSCKLNEAPKESYVSLSESP